MKVIDELDKLSMETYNKKYNELDNPVAKSWIDFLWKNRNRDI